MYNSLVNRNPSLRLHDTLQQLKDAETELHDLDHQLRTFETQVDAHLGKLLDQLSDLNAETAALDTQLRHIREERLYGKERMQYTDGAPHATRPPNLGDLSPHGISSREAIHIKSEEATTSEQSIPDIKILYRKLARRYHPDLARSDSDRVASNAQMIEINQAYDTGDIKTMLRLAGIGLPYGVELPEPSIEMHKSRSEPMNEQEQAERKLKAIRQQIARMSSLPIIKLSLEVKLAAHQGRNLLREMAADLQYKVGRKLAERDYLQAQINANNSDTGQ
jgi:hypothetical protein